MEPYSNAVCQPSSVANMNRKIAPLVHADANHDSYWS